MQQSKCLELFEFTCLPGRVKVLKMKFWKTLSSKRLSNSHKDNGGDAGGGGSGVYKAPVNVLSSVSTTPALTRRRSNGNRDGAGHGSGKEPRPRDLGWAQRGLWSIGA